MKRREFVQAIPLTALLPAGLTIPAGTVLAEDATAGEAPAGATPRPATTGGGSGTGAAPDFAKHILTSDMDGTGPDGKSNGLTATFTGASKAGATADSASEKMELTIDLLGDEFMEAVKNGDKMMS